jgi:UDP-glucose 4-epimerase
MQVAVTGGAGYIGSVVTDVLIREHHAVLVLDNLVKGHRDAVHDDALFANVDLAERSAIGARLRDFGCEAVIHMAAHSLVGESVTDPAIYYRNNVVAGLSLLDAMRDAGVERLVFSSSAAVYGEPDRQPITEDAPTQPTSPYGETKLVFERVLRWYAAAYGLRSVSLRYFNAAGATVLRGERHEPETHLIPLVLRAAMGELPYITVFGTDYQTADGTCVRDYIHVEDLAHAHVLALRAVADQSGCRSYNLGCGGDGYSVRQVIDSAREITGRPIPVREAARRPGDPAVLIASSERIIRELQWSPRVQDVGAIVASTWDWMRRARKQPMPQLP